MLCEKDNIISSSNNNKENEKWIVKVTTTFTNRNKTKPL